MKLKYLVAIAALCSLSFVAPAPVACETCADQYDANTDRAYEEYGICLNEAPPSGCSVQLHHDLQQALILYRYCLGI